MEVSPISTKHQVDHGTNNGTNNGTNLKIRTNVSPVPQLTTQNRTGARHDRNRHARPRTSDDGRWQGGRCRVTAALLVLRNALGAAVVVAALYLALRELVPAVRGLIEKARELRDVEEMDEAEILARKYEREANHGRHGKHGNGRR